MNMSQPKACNGDIGENVVCDDLNPWDCYYQQKRDDCCSTCNATRSDLGVSVPGCDYGDRMPECGDLPFVRHCYNMTVRETCCSTCFSEDTNIPGCPYGDRVPGCSNLIGPNGRHCYNMTLEEDCCSTCRQEESNIPACKYGDRAGNCQDDRCPNYSNKQLNDCCATCSSSTTRPPPQTVRFDLTTDGSTYSSTIGGTPRGPLPGGGGDGGGGDKGSSDTQGWVIPVAAGIGGVVVLVIIILVVCFLIRRRKKKPDVITDEMYKEYKLSKRAPIAPPRPDIDDKKRSKLVRQDSAEYAYIHPNDVATDPGKEQENSLKKREGNDPLPQVPGEYVYLTNRDAYGYMEPVKRFSKSDPYTSLDAANGQPGPYAHLGQATDENARRNNSYGKFPQGMHDNKGFLAESVKL